MEIKEFLEKTISGLASLSDTEQVLVFNEIKFTLLDIRKRRFEENETQIKQLDCLNAGLREGNASIVGEPSKAASAEISRGY